MKNKAFRLTAFVLLVLLSSSLASYAPVIFKLISFTLCGASMAYLRFCGVSELIYASAPIAFMISYFSGRGACSSSSVFLPALCCGALVICVKRGIPRTMCIGVCTCVSALCSLALAYFGFASEISASALTRFFAYLSEVASPYAERVIRLLTSGAFSERLYDIIISIVSVCIPSVFALLSMLCCYLVSVLFKFFMLTDSECRRFLPAPWLVRTDVCSALLFSGAFFVSVYSLIGAVLVSGDISIFASICFNIVLLTAPLMAVTGIKWILLNILKRKRISLRIILFVSFVLAVAAFPLAALPLFCVFGVSVSLKGSVKLLVLKNVLKKNDSDA